MVKQTRLDHTYHDLLTVMRKIRELGRGDPGEGTLYTTLRVVLDEWSQEREVARTAFMPTDFRTLRFQNRL